MSTEDKTGTPRSLEELEQALKAVEKAIVKQAMEVPPALLLELTTIGCLQKGRKDD